MDINEGNVQKYLAEANQLEQTVRYTQESIKQVQSDLETLTLTTVVLNDVDKASKSSLFSVGAGVYVRGKVTDTKNVLLNLPGDVTIEKTVPEAQQIMEQRIIEKTSMIKKMTIEYEKSIKKLDEINQAAQKYFYETRKA